MQEEDLTPTLRGAGRGIRKETALTIRPAYTAQDGWSVHEKSLYRELWDGGIEIGSQTRRSRIGTAELCKLTDLGETAVRKTLKSLLQKGDIEIVRAWESPIIPTTYKIYSDKRIMERRHSLGLLYREKKPGQREVLLLTAEEAFRRWEKGERFELREEHRNLPIPTRPKMNQQFLVVYEFANGSYSGYAPDLPGRISAGGTHEEMRKNMRDTVENHVGSLDAQGNPVPSLVTHTVHCPEPIQESDVKHWIIEQLEIEVPVSSRTAQELASP